MTPSALERVFGRGRLQMVTGRHVEVFREAARPGERRCYTKRFLATDDGDFRAWTEREWRVLARMFGHGVRCVPEVVQFNRGERDGAAFVKTYDAGVTVDHWATLLPVERAGHPARHVFDDCAHWWSLAHHCLLALQQVHELQLIHLDLKADNVCIPIAPPVFDPQLPQQRLFLRFDQLALIDFAFSLVAGEEVEMPLPMAAQTQWPYQSPRLLRALEAGRAGELGPTRDLDWRCDMFSLAAMLERYLPQPSRLGTIDAPPGWTQSHLHEAGLLLRAIRDSHDQESAAPRPHAQLLARSGAVLDNHEFRSSLESGWNLVATVSDAGPTVVAPTPVTRIAPSLQPMPAALLVADADAQPAQSALKRRHWRWQPGRRVAAAAVAAVAIAGAGMLAFNIGSSTASRAGDGQPSAQRRPVPVRASTADLRQKGKVLLGTALLRAAAQAERDVAWVLFQAASAQHADQDDSVVDAANAMKRAVDLAAAPSRAEREGARRLHEEASRSAAARRDIGHTLGLELQAFGANPQDADVVARLAQLHLQLSPPQPETARQLALYALALRESRDRLHKPEDWVTLAAASALSGRELDARHALLVVASTSDDMDAACRLALRAANSYGERMRTAVDAMMYRLRTRGVSHLSPYCAWPPRRL